MLTRFIFLLLIFLTTAISAAVVDDLYLVTVPMASTQDVSAQSAAITEACQNVLLKISGNSTVLTNPSLHNACQQPDDYVEQYHYSSNAGTDATQLPYLLLVTFSPQAINHLLNQAGLPMWGRERPVILFWVAEAINNQQQILSASSNDAIVNLIDSSADRRGLPILFPVLDLTDTQQVSFNDVMAPFVNTILQASTRYGSNAIVMVRFTQEGGVYQSQWTLSINGKLTNWSFSGPDLATVVQQGVDAITDVVASQFAQKTITSQKLLMLQINGISTLDAFSKAQHYLAHLTAVQQVNLVSITGTQVLFKVNLTGNIAVFQQTLALDSLLTSLDTPNTNNSILHYRWTP